MRQLLTHSFFFNHTATTEIYTLSLHDALPICIGMTLPGADQRLIEHVLVPLGRPSLACGVIGEMRSEEHTSELQSPVHLVCRLLLEKKKTYYETQQYFNANAGFRAYVTNAYFR